MARPLPWLRIVAEGVVIAASVLIALAADAWWEGRQERREEGEYLAAILSEIDDNLANGNREILERSYSDLARAQSLLRTGSHADSARAFLESINRGLIYGVPTIATAVFDELTSTGRLVIIEDVELRRMIVNTYARIDAELARFAPTYSSGLPSLAARHTPPGLVQQVGPRFSMSEDGFTSTELRAAAAALGAEAALPGAINAELRRRESERAFLDSHQESLERARERLLAAVEPRLGA